MKVVYIQWKLYEKTRRHRLVFFGDGSFSSCSRGSCPISKKTFIKLLAPRGVTVYLDEFRTSLMCPYGTSELVNGKSSGKFYRIRCHKTFIIDR